MNKTFKTGLLLNTPLLNKGTAFNKQERIKFNLLGKLPFRIETLPEQVIRAYSQFKSYNNPQQQNIFLHELYATNQMLFYKLVADNLEEMVPIIYTPHVALNCTSFSHEFRRPCGAYISYPDRNHLTKIMDNIIHDQIEIIVVTDGERILGIGDQGVGGIGIPVGKLMLYTLLGGIDPKKTLPIVLDVGTNNKKLLSDPQYLGWRHPRIATNDYLAFIDQFITILKQKLPHVLLQWEDFGKQHAWQLLERYRKKICSFNDDIQGTAAVTLAALLAAIKTSQQKLSEQRIVIFGAGSAAIGIAKMLSSRVKPQNIWLIDCDGLITDQLKNITEIQRPYLHKITKLKNWQVKNINNIPLFEVIHQVKPTILLGCSTAKNAFTKKIIEEMAKHVKQPIIFPLSNPITNCEATPNNLIKWTEGRALIATGSPFPPVMYKNKKIVIAQCNNALIFPGIGLGVIASKAREITDEMFWGAAEILYKKSPSLKNPQAPLLPSLKDIPAISKIIGEKVAAIAMRPTKTNIRNVIAKISWVPKY